MPLIAPTGGRRAALSGAKRMNQTYSENSSSPGNLSFLPTSEEYSVYFRQLVKVCEHLADCYQQSPDDQQWEGKVVRQLALQLLNTVHALEMKYAYREQDSRSLLIDVTESGFPNHVELSEIESDLKSKALQLRDLPGVPVLKQALAEELLRGNTEPAEILRQLSRRSYLDCIDEAKLFLPFNAGPLLYSAKVNPTSVMRPGRHQTYFSCFDFSTNRPYIHFLTFDFQSPNQELTEDAIQFKDFSKVLREVGSRAPDIGILAMSLDEALDDIRPKILKRLCIGPLYSRVLLENRPANPADKREAYLKSLLHASKREDDFVLLLTEEVIFSKRQEHTKSIFSPKGRAREIFAISETDPECLARRASAVQHYYLMSHELLQQMQPGAAAGLADFSRAKKLAIDDLGEIHGL